MGKGKDPQCLLFLLHQVSVFLMGDAEQKRRQRRRRSQRQQRAISVVILGGGSRPPPSTPAAADPVAGSHAGASVKKEVSAPSRLCNRQFLRLLRFSEGFDDVGIVPVGRIARIFDGGGNSAPFPDAPPAATIVLSSSTALDKEQGKKKLTTTSPEVYTRYGETEEIKVRSALQTRLSSITLIEPKNAVPSHVIVVVIEILLLLNRP